ncbi:hypothetical protein MRY82_06900 [bacterium]|nr:hypothetical protein [bacterium]
MFGFLPEVCGEIRAHLVSAYWMMLVPFVLFLIILEFLNVDEYTPNPMNILKRTVISIIILLSFEQIMGIIAMVGDGLTEHINGIGQLTDLLDEIQKNYEETSPKWLQFREALIFVINLVSYLIAYIGIFITNILIQFVWSILYVVSPLMILMYVSRYTSFITASLFKGLIQVTIWKVLWSILGVMLLKFAVSPEVQSWDNFFTTALVNLCIGLSMIFVPIATNSLISSGLQSVATGVSAMPVISAGHKFKQNLMSSNKDNTKFDEPKAQQKHYGQHRANRSFNTTLNKENN